ncbi:MAG: LptF/LptG family permease, partial [Gammaproteobacteria bacterium]|nr:LptF/LptG family permease [Gammaproteobacteria bacterium]
MKLLRRYIGTTVIGTILMVVLVIISLEMFINFTSEFSDMGTGNYGLMRVIIYVFMCLPGAIYQFFPMAGLLGSLIGLGLMASRSELIVMRAAGVSLVQITGSVI